MKTAITSLLLLLAGAAVAQEPQSTRVYGIKDGHLVLLDSLRPGTTGSRVLPKLSRQAKRQPAPGSYRAEPYALRVQVPVPHPDAAAVVAPGHSADLMPRHPLPLVRLRPQ